MTTKRRRSFCKGILGGKRNEQRNRMKKESALRERQTLPTPGKDVRLYRQAVPLDGPGTAKREDMTW